MSTLEFAPGTRNNHYETIGLRVEDIDENHGVTRAKSRDHTLVLKRSPVVTTPYWNGKYHSEELWPVGSVAMLPAEHEWGCFPEEPYSCTIIRLEDRMFVEAAREHINYNHIDFRYADVGNSGVSKVAGVVRDMAIAGMLEKYPMLSESLTLALAVETIDRLAPDEAARLRRVKNGLSRERKRRVIDFTEDNLGTLVSLSDMAAAANLSPFHFSRSFKQSVGMSPAKYMLSRRIEKAKRLLLAGESIAAVSHDLAFSSQSHFTTAFKTIVGVTPAVFRATVMS